MEYLHGSIQLCIDIFWNTPYIILNHCYYYVTDPNYRQIRKMAALKPQSWTMVKSLQLHYWCTKARVDQIAWGEGCGILGTDVIIATKSDINYTFPICGCCSSLGVPKELRDQVDVD